MGFESLLKSYHRSTFFRFGKMVCPEFVEAGKLHLGRIEKGQDDPKVFDYLETRILRPFCLTISSSL